MTTTGRPTVADEVHAKDDGAKFEPHPEGQYAAVCADVIALGDKVETFAGQNPRVVRKCALVFQTGILNSEDEPHEVSAEFTISMNMKAGLRLFLESWRGKSYTDEQAQQGVPVHKLAGVFALLSVEHKKSAKGRTYAKIKSVAPMPKGLPAPVAVGYHRADFWAERKKQYAEEVAKFRRETAASSHDDFDPPPEDDDDDLPF